VTVGTTLLYAALGHLVARRHAGHPVARVLQLAGLLGAAVVVTGGHANAALFGPLPDTGAALTLWLSRWLWIPTAAAASIGLLLCFPDGRLPTPRWRPAAVLAAAAPVLLVLDFATLPFTESVWQPVPVESPIGPLAPGVRTVLEAIAHPALVLGVAVGAAAVVVRRHRAGAEERRRYGLVIWPAVLLPPALLASWLVPVGGVAEMAVGTALPIAVAVAMLRHHLFDLDVVINRASVHALLVVSLFGAYVSVVALVSALVDDDLSWPSGVVAAVVVAALAGPLLSRLRTGGRPAHVRRPSAPRRGGRPARRRHEPGGSRGLQTAGRARLGGL